MVSLIRDTKRKNNNLENVDGLAAYRNDLRKQQRSF